MNLRQSQSGQAVVCAAALLVMSLLLKAQEAPDGAAGAGRRNGTARPPTPTEATPVDYFRQLLAANEGERERLLSSRPVSQHAQFRAIIEDYLQRTPEERERRLQALELRYRITSILRLAPEARTQAVARLSEAVRPLVQGRLDYWDKLEPDVQQALLDNERLMRVITFVSAGRPAAAVRAPGSNEVSRIELAMRNFNSLPEGKRAEAEEAFRKVFELGTVQATSGTAPLHPSDRDEIQQALNRFKHLSPGQRLECVSRFSKLAEMTAPERAAFLRSADEWQRMNAEDRQAWKKLVKRTPVFPPFPTGFRTLPPLPPRAKMTLPAVQTATKTNGHGGL